MRDSVPSASYSSVCNVLRQWNIPLIPTYRVYRLYDTSEFLTNGYGTPLVDAVCKILHAPKRFFGDVSFYAVSIGSNLVKDIYTCMQFLIHLRASLLLNDREYHVKKQGGVAA